MHASNNMSQNQSFQACLPCRESRQELQMWSAWTQSGYNYRGDYCGQGNKNEGKEPEVDFF